MRGVHGFCDLNVRYESEKSLISQLKTLKNLGYRNIAINQVVEEVQCDDKSKKKKKKKGEPNQEEEKPLIPPPVNLDNIPKELKESLLIFQRVTFYYSTMDQSHKMMQSENLKLYDIVAVVPTSQIALQHACGVLDIDVIAMDPINRSNLILSRKLYNMAVDRNMFFELTYGSAISGSSSRKLLFSTGHNYFVAGKSKNIIVSSDTIHSIHLRSPYDVINLSYVCGLSQDQAKKAVTSSPRCVLLKGESRKRGKAVVFAELLPTPGNVSTDDSMHVSETEDSEEETNSITTTRQSMKDKNSSSMTTTNEDKVQKNASPKSPYRKKMRCQ